MADTAAFVILCKDSPFLILFIFLFYVRLNY